MIPQSIEGVAHVERVDGRDASPSAAPALLVEVPHGADLRAHYDALHARMVGTLPRDLHVFFHVNTDVGAWDLGRRTAERLVALHPERSALLIRCLIPRTFVDANRVEDAADGLGSGGMTAGVAPYVRDERDITLLLELHRAYVRLIERGYEEVCGAGGLVLTPHTYGPRRMGIAKIDDSIVEQLRAAHEPEAWASWRVRSEIDLITKTAEGHELAPEGTVESLRRGYEALGVGVVENGEYTLHPATQSYRWSTRYPRQVLALEVRRDLLVPSYAPFEEMRAERGAVEKLAEPIVSACDAWLRGRGK